MRVAVIGTGRMGLRHLQVIRNLGLTLCAVHDSNLQRAHEACEQLGLAQSLVHNDVATLLTRAAPEGVVVSTTAPAHRDIVCAAAAAGVRYVLCEKPMAISDEQATQMIEACAASGTRLAINHQMRFMPQYTTVKAITESEALGGIVSILVAGSNFGLAMNGAHYFEMFRFITGSAVSSIRALLEPSLLQNPRGPQFADRSGRLWAASADDYSMFIDFSARSGHGIQTVYVCRMGQIVVDELSGFVRLIHRQDADRSLPTSRYGTPAGETLSKVPEADVIAPTEAVWRSLLGDGAYPDGAVGQHALRCLLAAHLSSDLGGAAISLDDPRIDRTRHFPWA